jgi:hypothetical protein
MEKIQLYIVVAPPWSGGNHLLNILRTSNIFYNSIPKDHQKRFYNENTEKNFHNNTDYNIADFTALHSILQKVNSTVDPIAVRIHLSQMILFYEELKNYKFKIILVDYPLDKDSANYKRIINNTPLDEFFYSEQVLLYKPLILSRLFNVDLDHICDLSIDTFHLDDVGPLLCSLENFLHCKFDHKLVQELQTIWLEKAFR